MRAALGLPASLCEAVPLKVSVIWDEVQTYGRMWLATCSLFGSHPMTPPNTLLLARKLLVIP